MGVYLCFGKSQPMIARHTHDMLGPIIAHLADAHSSVMLGFVCGAGGATLTVFDINMNTHGFKELGIPSDVTQLQQTYDFLDLDVSEDEYARLLATCQACVRARKRYNYRDVVLYNVPFREPVEKSLFETETLFDAQAVILILRECLSTQHPVLPVLHALHSRTTMANQLYELLSAILPCVHASRVCGGCREVLSVMPSEHRSMH